MSVELNSRKRARSTSSECVFTNQRKCLINQQMIDQNDANRMKEIHDKTIKLLFKNAKMQVEQNGGARKEEPSKMERFRNNIRLMGNGQINYMTGTCASTKGPGSPQRKCQSCFKASHIETIECTSCNMETCEFCGVSCIQCNEPLCLSCVQVFGCCDNSSEANACCEKCKQIFNI